MSCSKRNKTIQLGKQTKKTNIKCLENHHTIHPAATVAAYQMALPQLNLSCVNTEYSTRERMTKAPKCTDKKNLLISAGVEGSSTRRDSSRQRMLSGAYTARPRASFVNRYQRAPATFQKEGPASGETCKRYPVTAATALKRYENELSLFEHSEILEVSQVYFVGKTAAKIKGIPQSARNYGYDDERGDYRIVLHDHIAYRFEVVDTLGKGSFGQVVKVLDHKTGTMQALKIIRNKKRFHHQALVEVRILEFCSKHDEDGNACIVRMKESLYFRNHLCITFELLSLNLYEFIKSINFRGVSLSLIRRFSIQMLSCLNFLRRHGIIHCDLKPENVLLKTSTKSDIQVIDFGSGCFEHQRVYTYIQSRFYRSPEVILGTSYNMAIDMWSFACILSELYTGYPLFPGENEIEQMACMMEVLNVPPPDLIANAPRRKMFFDTSGKPRVKANSRGRIRRPGTHNLASAMRCSDRSFLDFLGHCLTWDPRKRLTPEQALQHRWIKINNSSLRAAPRIKAKTLGSYGAFPSIVGGKGPGDTTCSMTDHQKRHQQRYYHHRLKH